ncbi:hypothetical protein DEO72_LG11g1741 [Vigna unguiculata]|uniref:Uncharacterized protein n=1 Tax=Vigna unguiculata TaxID=3917 RepID=A0A4D6NM61_VIGUN|nr:hypothetical protein DEO72_LG11g1741 [Vigna unguiculata]
MPEILGRVLGVESQVFWWLLPLFSFVSDGKQSKSAKRMRNVSAPAAAKAAHRQGALLVSLQVGSGVGAH